MLGLLVPKLIIGIQMSLSLEITCTVVTGVHQKSFKPDVTLNAALINI